jgi:hypothetical protein
MAGSGRMEIFYIGNSLIPVGITNHRDNDRIRMAGFNPRAFTNRD